MEVLVFDDFKYRLVNGQVDGDTKIKITAVNSNFEKLLDYKDTDLNQYRREQDIKDLIALRKKDIPGKVEEFVSSKEGQNEFEIYSMNLDSAEETIYDYAKRKFEAELDSLSDYKADIEMRPIEYFLSEEESNSKPFFVDETNFELAKEKFPSLRQNENLESYIEKGGFYCIESDDNLEWFADRVNNPKTFNNKINGVIVRAFKMDPKGDTDSIGTVEHHFEGILDGNNIPLSEFTVTTKSDIAGLVGVLGRSGIVRNFAIRGGTLSNSYRINIEHLKTKSTNCYHGLLVGINYGYIEKCKFLGDFKPRGYIPSAYVTGNKTDDKTHFKSWRLNDDNFYYPDYSNTPGYLNTYCLDSATNSIPYAGYFAEGAFALSFAVNKSKELLYNGKVINDAPGESFHSMILHTFSGSLYGEIPTLMVTPNANEHTSLPMYKTEDGVTSFVISWPMDRAEEEDPEASLINGKTIYLSYDYFMEDSYHAINRFDGDYNFTTDQDLRDSITKGGIYHRRMHTYLRNAFYISPICGVNNGIIEHTNVKFTIVEGDETFVGFVGGIAGKNGFGMVGSCKVSSHFKHNEDFLPSVKSYPAGDILWPTFPSELHGPLTKDNPLFDEYTFYSSSPITALISLRNRTYELDLDNWPQWSHDDNSYGIAPPNTDRQFTFIRLRCPDGIPLTNSDDEADVVSAKITMPLREEYYVVPLVNVVPPAGMKNGYSINISAYSSFGHEQDDGTWKSKELLSEYTARQFLLGNSILCFRKIDEDFYYNFRFDYISDQVSMPKIVYYDKSGNRSEDRVLRINHNISSKSGKLMTTVSLFSGTQLDFDYFKPGNYEIDYIQKDYTFKELLGITNTERVEKTELEKMNADAVTKFYEKFGSVEKIFEESLRGGGTLLPTTIGRAKLPKYDDTNITFELPSIWNIGCLFGSMCIVGAAAVILQNIELYSDIDPNAFSNDDSDMQRYFLYATRLGMIAAVADMRASDVRSYDSHYHGTTDRYGVNISKTAVCPKMMNVKIYCDYDEATGDCHVKTGAIIPDVEYSPFPAPGVLDYKNITEYSSDQEYYPRCNDDVPIHPFVMQTWPQVHTFGRYFVTRDDLVPVSSTLNENKLNCYLYIPTKNERDVVLDETVKPDGIDESQLIVTYRDDNTVAYYKNEMPTLQELVDANYDKKYSPLDFDKESHAGRLYDMKLCLSGHFSPLMKGFPNLSDSIMDIVSDADLDSADWKEFRNTLMPGSSGSPVLVSEATGGTFQKGSMADFDNEDFTDSDVDTDYNRSAIYDYHIYENGEDKDKPVEVVGPVFDAKLNYLDMKFKLNQEGIHTGIWNGGIPTFKIGNDYSPEYIMSKFEDPNYEGKIETTIPYFEDVAGLFIQDTDGNNIAFIRLDQPYMKYTGNLIVRFPDDALISLE